MQSTTGPAGTRRRRRDAITAHLALAIACYAPLVLFARDELAADTRQAIYLDPGRYLSDALSMWDPSRDLGTVTHQNIVLVWPMGFYYWLTGALGVPQWFAQRIWLGSILFLAGAGVLFLARTLRWDSRLGPVVAAFAYAMSPYVIQYGTRTSVLLLPWAALPWLIALTARALETKGWRHPALIALVAASIAVNATALALALLGPALWIAWSVWGARTVSVRAAGKVVARIAALGLATSVWWVVALLIESRYGLPLLNYTETVDQVATTSSATEVLRGLGYWVPYLQQHGYPEVSGAVVYLQDLKVLAIELLVVVVAFAGLVLVRWRYRSFFALMVVVGVVVGVGAYPTTDASPLSSLFHDLARSGGIGLALRSTSRAAPLALLGLACSLGVLVDVVAVHRRRLGGAMAAALVVVSVALAPAVAGAELVDPMYSRPEALPDDWQQAIARADAEAGTGRMLEIPGTRFAAYRWGTTYEPITAGNATVPTAWREQIPYGGAGSADVLIALDNRLQEGLLDPAALAPVARLLGASELLVRNDLQYERYDTVAPDRVWSVVTKAPGLGTPEGFGPVGVNQPDPAYARDDQPTPADPTATYPPVAVVPVKDAPGLVQVVPVSDTVVLDGDGDGIVDAAAAGVVDGRAPVLEAAATAAHPELVDKVLNAGARVVVTDTNRRRVRRWRYIKNTTGITLRADEDPSAYDGLDGGEAPLDVFPDATDPAWQTVAVPRGAKVTANRYGNTLWFESAFRPAAAMDGNPDTAWQVGPILDPNDHLNIALDTPVTTDHIQLAATRDNTALTAVDLSFDGGPPQRVELDASSRASTGQTISFPTSTFTNVSIGIADTAPTDPTQGDSSVGIAEVGIAGADGAPIVVDPVVRVPTALLDRLGASSAQHPLSFVLTRLRGDVTGAPYFQEEATIERELDLPTARTFTLTGQVRGSDGQRVDPDPTCRTDLVTVDGNPVPVRFAAGGPDDSKIEGCGPLALSAGSHVVRTTNAGLNVDRLVLDSDAPAPAAATTTAPTWHDTSNTEVSLTSPATTGPSWVFLGQSKNDGWQLSGASGAEGPYLLNGFGNGWYVDAPLAAGTALTFQWAPQHLMQAALLLSALGALVAIALAVRGRRWAPAGAAVSPSIDVGWSPDVLPGSRRTALAAAGVGVTSALVIAPGWGIVVAATVFAAGRSSRGRALLRGAALAMLVVALGSVVVDRLGRHDELPFSFFTSLHAPSRLALVALALLAGEVIARPRATDS